LLPLQWYAYGSAQPEREYLETARTVAPGAPPPPPPHLPPPAPPPRDGARHFLLCDCRAQICHTTQPPK